MSELAANAAKGPSKARADVSATRLIVWPAAAAVLIALPLIFKSGTSLTVLTLTGIAIVFALSYNILLGQTGLLSFGHAVYYGLGAYFTVHAINAITQSALPVPLPFLPLIGGLAGLFFSAVFGWVSTKRSGTAFAMISLGLAELIGSSSLILRSFFGGEEGVSTNRTKLLSAFGWNFGPQLQVYYLIAFWCLAAAAAMYALTRTPFGRMCNAVRENPGRVAFIGYNPQTIRFMAFCFAGFFGGIAGGLAAIHYELANSAIFGATQSGMVLIAAFIGGAGYFLGPILGAIIVTYLQTMLSDYTNVWQLYFGLFFIATVMFAPGGLAHLIMIHRAPLRAGALWRLIPAYLLLLGAISIFMAGAVMIIEMSNHLLTKAAEGPVITFFGFGLNTKDWHAWISPLAGLSLGGLALHRVMRPLSSAWDRALSGASARGLDS
jgi:branched-chain amino acid transport system permease protein